MDKTIYKYEVPLTDIFTISMPKGSEILTVQTQHGIPKIWVLIDDPHSTCMEYIDRNFRLSGTGHPIKQEMGIEYKYINTFQVDNGSLIFHLFEIL